MNPIVRLVMKLFNRWVHANDIFYTLSPEHSIAILKARDLVDEELLRSGAYYEFGVFKGYNLWFANRVMPGTSCYGFDSFEGMPKTEHPHPYHSKGQYAASLKLVESNLRRYHADNMVSLFKGWFSTENFQNVAKHVQFKPAAIVLIDCDLYESTVPVMAFLKPYLRPGTIILFGSWLYEQLGEQKAAIESGIQTERLFDFGVYGRAVRIKPVVDRP